MLPSFSRPNQRRTKQHCSTMDDCATPSAPLKPLLKSMMQSPRHSPTAGSSLDKRRTVHRDDFYSVKAMSLLVEECESRATVKCKCRKITSLVAACGFAAAMAFFGNMTLVFVLRKQATERVTFRDEVAQIERLGEVPDNAIDGTHRESNGIMENTAETTDKSSIAQTPSLEESNPSLQKPQPLASSNETLSSLPKTLQVPPKKQERRHRDKPDRSKDSPSQPRRTVPLPKPLPESLAANSTFSACLLIKDDNDILSEWIAYHYYALNLRHLVVAVDPFSVESPHAILETWRNSTDLDVRAWSDADFMPLSFLQTGQAPPEYVATETDLKSSNMSDDAVLAISNHRYRQRVFLASCMKDLRAAGRTWVIHIDTDEYVVPSKLLRQRRPDDIPIPPMEQPGAILQLIQFVTRKDSALVHYPCISMLRVLFGSVESRSELLRDGVPEPYVASRFETLRWRYHALPHQTELHGNPKVILDVRAIPERYFEPQVVFSIHRPIHNYCLPGGDAIYSNIRQQPIAVNHYLGSWERYAKRSDKRRSRDIYDSKAKLNRGKDDGYMRPWLQGFVNLMGPAVAYRLLDPNR